MIKITMAELLSSIVISNGEPSAFARLRQQPVPVSVGLKLIEIGKVLESKGDSFNQAMGDLQKRHLNGSESLSDEQMKALQSDRQELLNQEVELQFPKFPLAVISEARLSTEHLESLRWLFEE